MYMYNRAVRILSFCLVLCLCTSITAQEADITEACAPREINFTAPGGQGAYFWDFDDNNVTSIFQNPIHVFADPGVYTVVLRDGEGGPEVGTILITLYEKPELNFSVDTNMACVSGDIQFTNLSTVDPGIDIANYQWVFGDGNSSITNGNASHTYELANLFSVSLLVKSNTIGCNSEVRLDDLVLVQNPQAEFVTIPELLSRCAPPLEVDFVNNSDGVDLTYLWNFDGTKTSSLENPSSFTYMNSGDFSIDLTVTDDIGCTSVASKDVLLGDPIAFFDIADTVCVGPSLEIIMRSSPGTDIWNFGDAIFERFSIDDPRNPIVSFPAPGLYTISLEVTVEGGCKSDTTITVYADEIGVTFVSDPSYACSDSMIVTFTPEFPDRVVSLTWLFHDGSNSFDNIAIDTLIDFDTLKYHLNREVTFTTSVIAISNWGCEASFSDSDTIHQPDARFMPDTIAGCAPHTVVFSDSSQSREEIINWEWIFGDGTIVNADTSINQEHTYTEPGEYTVQLVVTNADGCIDSSYCVIISVGELLEGTLLIDPSEVCAGDTITIINTTEGDYQSWSYNIDGGPFDDCPGDTVRVAVPMDAGSYEVFFQLNQAGCITDIVADQFITVNGFKPNPYYEVNCDTPFDIFIADSTRDDATRSWTLDGTVISTAQSFTHTFPDTGDYTIILTLTDPSGQCPDAIDSLKVCVRNIKSVFELEFAQCFQQPFDLTGAMSEDVFASCWRGYKWIGTDQRPITTMEDTIMYSFQDTGHHSMTLVVNDINGCVDSSTINVKVYDIKAGFIVDPFTFCLPADLMFTDTSFSDTTIISWQWDVGGQIFDEQNPTVTITSYDGDFIPVSLTVQNAANCPSVAVTELRVYEPTSEIITIPAIPEICVGESIQFLATDFTEEGSFLNFFWDFKNAQTGTNQVETITFDVPGVYVVMLTYTEDASGCMGMETVTVVVQDFPMAMFSSDADEAGVICPGTAVEFYNETVFDGTGDVVWDLGDGNISTNDTAIAQYEDPGIYTVRLISVSSFGCQDTFERTYEVIDLTGDFTVEPTEFCLGDEVTFTLIDTSNVESWLWDFGDGRGNDNLVTVTNVFDSVRVGETVATLILRGEGGCERLISKVLDIEIVEASFETDQMADSSLCPMPIMFFNTSTANATSFEWDFGDGTSSIEENPTHEYSVSKTYTVTLTATSARGCVDSFSSNRDFQSSTDIAMPLAFSPNNDQLNDRFRPWLEKEAFRDDMIVEKFQIFRRWNGKLVYDNQDGMAGWDGTENGERSPTEVYYYFIVVRGDGCAFSFVMEGDVTLVR